MNKEINKMDGDKIHIIVIKDDKIYTVKDLADCYMEGFKDGFSAGKDVFNNEIKPSGVEVN